MPDIASEPSPDIESILRSLDEQRGEVYTRVEAALGRIEHDGLHMDGSPPIEYLRAKFNNGGRRAITSFSHAGWVNITTQDPLTLIDAKLFAHESLASLTLSPDEVTQILYGYIETLLMEDPIKASEFIARLKKENPPLAYIYHMTISRHTGSILDIAEKLLRGRQLRTPLLDAGCGPGHVLWSALQRGLVEPGEIDLVDPDSAAMAYGQRLFTNQPSPTHHPRFFIGGAESLEDFPGMNGRRYPTIVSSMALQWVPNPEGAIATLIDHLADDGEIYIVGEDPVDATAPTPYAFHHDHLDIGYSKGISFRELYRLLQKMGLDLTSIQTVNMRMPDTAIEPSVDLDLARAMSEHTMAGMLWRKRRK